MNKFTCIRTYASGKVIKTTQYDNRTLEECLSQCCNVPTALDYLTYFPEATDFMVEKTFVPFEEKL
jgi:hypothetical protein